MCHKFGSPLYSREPRRIQWNTPLGGGHARPSNRERESLTSPNGHSYEWSSRRLLPAALFIEIAKSSTWPFSNTKASFSANGDFNANSEILSMMPNRRLHDTLFCFIITCKTANFRTILGLARKGMRANTQGKRFSKIYSEKTTEI